MAIDKRINYAWGGPGGKSPGTSASGGTRGGGGPPGGGDRQMTYSAPAPSRGPVTTAKAPPSILSRPAAPLTRNIHVDTPKIKAEQKEADELNRQKAIRDIIAQQQEEKYGPLADPTKFGETVEDKIFKNHPEARAKEAERTIKQLSTPKGTKEALREFKALKTGRQYRPDIGLLEKLGIKKPEGILGSLVDTGQKYFDPKKMAMNFAMKKLGLGFLNPFLGIASLFKGSKFDPFTGGKKPDMSAFNKLGLQANRVPTQTMDTTQQAKARDAYKQPISTQIAKGTGLEKGYEMLGLHKGERDIAAQQARTYSPGQTRMSGRTSKSKSLGQALAESPMTLFGLDPDKAGVAQDPSLLELGEIRKAGLSPQKYAEASQYGLQEDLMERGPLGTLTGMGAALAGPFVSALASPVYDTLQAGYRAATDPNLDFGQALKNENIWEMTKGRTSGSAKFLADQLGIGNFRDKMVSAITPSKAAASGGFIDRPLMGRKRDI